MKVEQVKMVLTYHDEKYTMETKTWHCSLSVREQDVHVCVRLRSRLLMLHVRLL